MSRKERERITIMTGVKVKELSQMQAAQLLGLSYRQTKRVWRRYQDEGDAGLVHRSRGRRSNRRGGRSSRCSLLRGGGCGEQRGGEETDERLHFGLPLIRLCVCNRG